MPYADGEFYDDNFKLDIWGFDNIPLSVLKLLDLNKGICFSGGEYFSNFVSLMNECYRLLNREFTSFEELETFCKVLSKVTGEGISSYMFQDSEY